jgi:hypothetical protein
MLAIKTNAENKGLPCNFAEHRPYERIRGELENDVQEICAHLGAGHTSAENAGNSSFTAFGLDCW